jgi:hypothetical protein
LEEINYVNRDLSLWREALEKGNFTIDVIVCFQDPQTQKNTHTLLERWTVEYNHHDTVGVPSSLNTSSSSSSSAMFEEDSFIIGSPPLSPPSSAAMSPSMVDPASSSIKEMFHHARNSPLDKWMHKNMAKITPMYGTPRRCEDESEELNFPVNVELESFSFPTIEFPLGSVTVSVTHTQVNLTEVSYLIVEEGG